MAAVALDALQKVFPNGTVAVDNLSLDIEHGEFMVLLGPSGSGKTTVLRLVAGLEEPTGGHIHLDGQLVDRLSPKQRNVAMVFQDFALYPHLTVHQNIAFPLRAAQVDDATTTAQVTEAAIRLGIDDLMDRLPHQLSGGEQQRVALARAAVRRPTVCLLDEPLSNLHTSLRLEMSGQIHDLNSTMGVTTLYVTHARSEALAVADRVAVLRRGRLQQVGTPHQVYDDPATLFVASLLIRDICLVQGALYAADRGAVIDLGGQVLRVSASDPGAAQLVAHHTDRVTVAIRSDALTLAAGSVAGSGGAADPAVPGGDILLRGTVRRVVDVGPEILVEVNTGAVPIVPDIDDRDVDPAPDADRGGHPATPGVLRRAIARLSNPAVAPAPTARTEYGFYPAYEPSGSPLDTAADLTLRLLADATPRPRVGEVLTLAVDLDKVYIFDGAGARIRFAGPDPAMRAARRA
ncbi:MAG TPA: ABC transporter ATP-binding protein [Micromonosporaceae bacterium]|nr:ABC transporter ATP-binding protein [Micromonosporaceae bacterium]